MVSLLTEAKKRITFGCFYWNLFICQQFILAIAHHFIGLFPSTLCLFLSFLYTLTFSFCFPESSVHPSSLCFAVSSSLSSRLSPSPSLSLFADTKLQLFLLHVEPRQLHNPSFLSGGLEFFYRVPSWPGISKYPQLKCQHPPPLSSSSSSSFHLGPNLPPQQLSSQRISVSY